MVTALVAACASEGLPGLQNAPRRICGNSVDGAHRLLLQNRRTEAQEKGLNSWRCWKLVKNRELEFSKSPSGS